MSDEPVLWQPSQASIESAAMTRLRQKVEQQHDVNLPDYTAFHRWSIENPGPFWESVWQDTGVMTSETYEQVLDDPSKMPGARWFEGARLNFAENLLRRNDDAPAILFYGEDKVRRRLSFAELRREVAQLAAGLRRLGVGPGDRVAAFLPNMPETVIGMLATASLGAVWSSTSPDFGLHGVLDRFSQIAPKVVIGADGYFYKGRTLASLDKLCDIVNALDSVEAVIVVSYTGEGDLSRVPQARRWVDVLDPNATEISFAQLPFDHPLYIMYSSGTTGLPKSIVHSAGGTLLQHLKELTYHCDLKADDRIFYFTTCGWMMWNWLVSSLAVGATLVLYDGNPFYPAADALFTIAEETKLNIFGTSARYLASLEEVGAKPRETQDLASLRAILSTGSPLSEESFDYVYRDIKSDVMLSSISGGTDIVSCFALGNPTLPVRRGYLQCRGLGMAVEAYDDDGKPMIHEKGELVCTKAFPSMPVSFWNDPSNEKYRSAYFSRFPGIWSHGDYIEIAEDGGVKIFGRSDATLNPGGVRIGTAEIYRVLETMPSLTDSLVVGQKQGDDERVILFVQMKDGLELDDETRGRIRRLIRDECTPRHVPARILEVAAIPYTINGKKVELAVKKILHGEVVKNTASMANPECLQAYEVLRDQLL